MPKQWENLFNEMDETIIEFFDNLRPPDKGEAHTWLIPLMVDLKMLVEKYNNQTIRSEIERCVKFIADADTHSSELVEIAGDEWLKENYQKI
jgi:hypothetical protein